MVNSGVDWLVVPVARVRAQTFVLRVEPLWRRRFVHRFGDIVALRLLTRCTTEFSLLFPRRLHLSGVSWNSCSANTSLAPRRSAGAFVTPSLSSLAALLSKQGFPGSSRDIRRSSIWRPSCFGLQVGRFRIGTWGFRMSASTELAQKPTGSRVSDAVRNIRAALRGTRHDYTDGPVGTSIFLLAVPMVLEMIMESLFALSDVFFVSRLGANAIATVGLTESLMIIVYTLAMGLSISATAVVARRVGERDAEGAARAAVQAVIIGLVISTTLAVIGAVFAPELLVLMGASPEVVATGSMFTRVMLGGSVTAFMLFIINAAFRGAGDAAVSMRILWISNAINIVLGPMLIFGVGPFPRLGVTGAAIATTTGRGIGLLLAFYLLMKGSGHLKVSRRHLAVEMETIRRMLRMSVNGTFQVLVGTLSWIALIRIVASFGSAAMAGYTIAVRIMMFALLPAWGLSNASATMVGQALGAAKPDRAERAVWTATRYNMAFLGAMGVVFLLFAPAIVAGFTADAAVTDVAVFGLRTMAIGFPLYAIGMVLTQSFNGAGDTTTPTRINIAVFWLFEIPLAWLLARHTSLGWHAVFGAVLAAYSAMAVVSTIIFRRGTWRRRRV
jgi:putative MATE family efflux protein